MRMWFEDIALFEHAPGWQVGGRCKIAYFVPILLSAEIEGRSKEKANQLRIFKDLWSVLIKTYSYEKRVAMLGYGSTPSTSIMTTSEFSQSLNEMQSSEAGIMRHPADHGLRI